nr:hypothetical protein [Tepidiforma sp.]
MTTLADFRERMRIDLQDPDGERWTDAALDRHFGRALAELSRAAPREARLTAATAPGSRELSLAGIPGLLGVARAEYPAGLEPPAFRRFAVFGSLLRFEDGPLPDGSDCRLWCRLLHEADDAGSTLPAALEDIAVLGATAFAAAEAASGTLERLTLNAGTAAAYAAMARERETAFRQLLRELGGRGRLRARRAGAG